MGPEDPASEVLQVTNPVSSTLNYPLGFDSQSREIKVDTNSGLSLHWHTLLNRSEADVSARGLVQRSSLSRLLRYLSKVCDSSRFFLTAAESGLFLRLG